MPDRVRESLEGFLLDSRNPDGGWGYYPGKSSRLEPTCWALLALGERATDASVLARWPTDGGLLLERPAGAPNFAFHGLGDDVRGCGRDEAPAGGVVISYPHETHTGADR